MDERTSTRIHAFLSAKAAGSMVPEDGRTAVAWGVQLVYYYGPGNGPCGEEWRHGPAASGIALVHGVRKGLWHAFSMASRMAITDASADGDGKPSLMVLHGFDNKSAESLARAARADGDRSEHPAVDYFHDGIKACAYYGNLGWPYEPDPGDLMTIADDAAEMAVEKSRETED